MARKRKPPSKPSNAYLISFGDTMTAMLAFFIVLVTLAKEQTGANLHTGTGSFVTAVRSMGLPGWFNDESSKQIQQLEDLSPKYVVEGDANSKPGDGDGPDEEDNELRVLDRDVEQLQRRIVEMEQQFDVSLEEESSGQVSFDLFDPLGGVELLPNPAKRILAQTVSLLSSGQYRLEIDVWSPTPSLSAMTRMARTARTIHRRIVNDFRLDESQQAFVSCATRIWPHSDERRPTLTINVIKNSAR